MFTRWCFLRQKIIIITKARANVGRFFFSVSFEDGSLDERSEWAEFVAVNRCRLKRPSQVGCGWHHASRFWRQNGCLSVPFRCPPTHACSCRAPAGIHSHSRKLCRDKLRDNIHRITDQSTPDEWSAILTFKIYAGRAHASDCEIHPAGWGE